MFVRRLIGLVALVGLLLISRASAAGRIEVLATLDGTDQIVITQEKAIWKHLFGDLAATAVQLNNVLWQPSKSLELLNSGDTTFLTNVVNFAAAQLTVINGQDTVVLERTKDSVTISLADTPFGVAGYRFVIDFPDSPTLEVEADIDGSDELHVSFAGARWIHKHWSLPTGVTLNGVPWNLRAGDFLTNAGATTFLSQLVRFENATLLSSDGRDLLTMRSSAEGIILNFADNPTGAGRYKAVIAFPEERDVNNASIAAASSLSIEQTAASGITVQTVRGVWYELQIATSLSPPDWTSTGSYVRGNGTAMTLFDPAQSEFTRFYRVVSRAAANGASQP